MLFQILEKISQIPPMRQVLMVLALTFITQSLYSHYVNEDVLRPINPYENPKENFQQLQYRQKQGMMYIGATVMLFILYMTVRNANLRQEMQDEQNEVVEEERICKEDCMDDQEIIEDKKLENNTSETTNKKQSKKNKKDKEEPIYLEKPVRNIKKKVNTEEDYWDNQMREEAYEYKRQQEKQQKKTVDNK